MDDQPIQGIRRIGGKVPDAQTLKSKPALKPIEFRFASANGLDLRYAALKRSHQNAPIHGHNHE